MFLGVIKGTRKAFLFFIILVHVGILYSGKFVLTAEFWETNAVVITKFICICNADMPTSRHCFPGDLLPESRRLDEKSGRFQSIQYLHTIQAFFWHFYIPYFAGYKSHRSVSRTGHFQLVFFFQILVTDKKHLSIGRMQGPLSFDFSAWISTSAQTSCCPS